MATQVWRLKDERLNRMFHMTLVSYGCSGTTRCALFGPQVAIDPETVGTLLTYLFSSVGHGITVMTFAFREAEEIFSSPPRFFDVYAPLGIRNRRKPGTRSIKYEIHLYIGAIALLKHSCLSPYNDGTSFPMQAIRGSSPVDSCLMRFAN